MFLLPQVTYHSAAFFELNLNLMFKFLFFICQKHLFNQQFQYLFCVLFWKLKSRNVLTLIFWELHSKNKQFKKLCILFNIPELGIIMLTSQIFKQQNSTTVSNGTSWQLKLRHDKTVSGLVTPSLLALFSTMVVVKRALYSSYSSNLLYR